MMKKEPTSVLFVTPEPEPVIEGEEVHPCTHSWNTKEMQTSYAGDHWTSIVIVTSVACDWCGAMHVAYSPVALK